MKLLNLLRWPWTKWADICVFDFGSYSYLLQGRRNTLTGRSQFAVRKFKQWHRIIEPHIVKKEDLQQVGLWNPEKP
jgi:hypothetical protein